jgi:hypothetical protein
MSAEPSQLEPLSNTRSDHTTSARRLRRSWNLWEDQTLRARVAHYGDARGSNGRWKEIAIGIPGRTAKVTPTLGPCDIGRLSLTDVIIATGLPKAMVSLSRPVATQRSMDGRRGSCLALGVRSVGAFVARNRSPDPRTKG